MIDPNLEKIMDNIYEKYPTDNDIWQLLQYVINMVQTVEQLKVKVSKLENRAEVIEAAFCKVKQSND